MYIVDLQTWGRAMPSLLKGSPDFFSNVMSACATFILATRETRKFSNTTKLTQR
jgi:hypothetical protein